MSDVEKKNIQKLIVSIHLNTNSYAFQAEYQNPIESIGANQQATNKNCVKITQQATHDDIFKLININIYLCRCMTRNLCRTSKIFSSFFSFVIFFLNVDSSSGPWVLSSAGGLFCQICHSV